MKFRIATCFWIGPLVIGLLATGTILAGNLDPVGDPTDTNTAMFTLSDIFNRLNSGAPGEKRTNSFVNPPTAPDVPTGHTLNEIMAKTPATNALAALAGNVLTGKVFWGLSSGAWGQQIGTIPTTNLAPNSAALAAGYYAATNLTQVDADLVSGNIATNVTIFGVAGTLNASTFPAPVARTGVTNSFPGYEDDGNYQRGVASPNPRFTVGTDASSNCVTDNLTGLMWIKNPWTNALTWTTQITTCQEMNGTTNGWGGYSDWRMPNLRELLSIIDYSVSNPALPVGHPFVGIQGNKSYWSSSKAQTAGRAWAVNTLLGELSAVTTSTPGCVLPVRGGQ